MTLWNQSQIGIRWTVGNEAWMGTLEFSLMSRAPLAVFLFGKSLAYPASAARPAVIALVAALLIARQPLSVADPVALAGAVLVVFIAVVATGFLPGAHLGALPEGGGPSTRLWSADNVSGLTMVATLAPQGFLSYKALAWGGLAGSLARSCSSRCSR